MIEVRVKTGEPLDNALRRLKHKMDIAGILEDCKRQRGFETPKQKHKRKEQNRIRRAKLKLDSYFQIPESIRKHIPKED